MESLAVSLYASHLVAYPHAHRSCPLLRRQLRTLCPRRDRLHYRDLGTGLDRAPPPPHVELVHRYGRVSSHVITMNVLNAHAIASALGPSRAGPISDRVVNPDALNSKIQSAALQQNNKFGIRTLDQAQQHRMPGTASSKTRACFWTPWR